MAPAPRRTSAGRGTALALLAVVLLAAGCSSAGSPSATTTTNPGRPGASSSPSTEFAGRGPYVAGTLTITVHGDRTVIWYPASRGSQRSRAPVSYLITSWLPRAVQLIVPKGFPDRVTEAAWDYLPFAPGRFPVVLFSHGTSGFPQQSSFLTTHLADWGFIVVAPDQTSRDLTAELRHRAQLRPGRDIVQLRAAVEAVRALADRADDLFSGHVLNGAVAVVGDSSGGSVALDMAAADPSVRVVVSLGGTPARRMPSGIPTLFVAAGSDRLVPLSSLGHQYAAARAPKALLVVDDTGHNVFDDICTIAHARGGMVADARRLRLPVPRALLMMATDGCNPPDLYPPLAWPLVEQATIAELRYGFGFDPTPLGLGTALASAFAGVRATYSSSGM